MNIITADGWLMVPYEGSDLARVEIGLGEVPQFRGAFLDSHSGQRVAKVRDPGRPRPYDVWLRIDGRPSKVGRVGLPK
jgi:hypothetical protein